MCRLAVYMVTSRCGNMNDLQPSNLPNGIFCILTLCHLHIKTCPFAAFGINVTMRKDTIRHSWAPRLVLDLYFVEKIGLVTPSYAGYRGQAFHEDSLKRSVPSPRWDRTVTRIISLYFLKTIQHALGQGFVTQVVIQISEIKGGGRIDRQGTHIRVHIYVLISSTKQSQIKNFFLEIKISLGQYFILNVTSYFSILNLGKLLWQHRGKDYPVGTRDEEKCCLLRESTATCMFGISYQTNTRLCCGGHIIISKSIYVIYLSIFLGDGGY